MTNPNMRDVGRETGYSIATVSRVLNNKGHVRPETRSRIIEAVHKLGYRPPVQNLVGLIVPDSSNPFFSQLGFMFENEFGAKGFHLLVSSSEGRIDREVQLIDQMLRLQVRGLIYIAAGNEPDGVVRLVVDPDLPVVLFDRQVGGASMDLVAVDSAKGTQSAVDYLHALGHERIGYIQGPLATGTAKDRWTAFRDAMTLHGLPVERKWTFEGEFRLDSGHLAGERLVDLAPSQRPTALMAANDLMAIGAMKALHGGGVRIPEDISIVGFDDIEIAAWVHPPLTTIAQPVSRLVNEVVALLLDRVRERGKGLKRRLSPRSLVLDPRLVVRDSSGPAAPREAPE